METKQNDNHDMHHANYNANNVQKVLVKHVDSDHTIMLSCNEKWVVKIGVVGCPFELCTKTKEGLVIDAFEVTAADHDAVMKHDLVPTVTFDIDTPKTTNLSHFYNAHAHVEVKYSAFLSTSFVIQDMEIGWVMIDKINKSMFLFVNAEGGGDRNYRVDRV